MEFTSLPYEHAMAHFGELMCPSGFLWCKQSNEQFARNPDKANKSNILARVKGRKCGPKLSAEPSLTAAGVCL